MTRYEQPAESKKDIIIDVLMQITELNPTTHNVLDPIINKLLTDAPLLRDEVLLIRRYVLDLIDKKPIPMGVGIRI